MKSKPNEILSSRSQRLGDILVGTSNQPTLFWAANRRKSTRISSLPVDVTGAVNWTCSSSLFLGKWKALILFHLFDSGTHRFAELRRKIPGISERMLTQQLRELEADEIVNRKVYPEVPPKVEYSLTRYGRTFEPVSKAMCKWGAKHMKRGK